MRSPGNAGKSRDINAIIREIRHYLPSQGPVKDFIHHNTLHMFQEHDLTFHEAIRQASLLYGAREYLPISEYRRRHLEGEITEEGLSHVLAPYKQEQGALREAMLTREVADIQRHTGFRQQGYLFAIRTQCGIVLEEQVHPPVYRLVANYLDQGIASLSLADYEGDFWQTLRAQAGVGLPFGVSRTVAGLIVDGSPEEVIDDAVDRLLPEGADLKTFLLEVLMAARGWSGLVGQVEDKPDYLNYPRRISLVQYLALYLAILAEAAERRGFDKTQIPVQNSNQQFFAKAAPEESEGEMLCRLWHEAFEMSFYLDALAALRVNAVKRRHRSSRAGSADLQAVFCIDDRECSLRRHLEELSEKIETFATPGFFGIDAVYQGPFDAISIKQCPVPVNPRHRIRGIAKSRRRLAASRFEMNFWHRYANHFALGWVISLFFGLASLVRLVFSVHRPSRTFATQSSFASHEDETDLHYERPQGDGIVDGFYEGYTVPEMAERVGRVLRQIGLTRDFAALVAIVGHGSSSTNNPYFAAYDCGACSGRPGLVNARAFALMANRSDVRVVLKKEGLSIPAATRFIGAIHDTARDEIIFLDEEPLPRLDEMKELFRQALAHNAHERTRRFAIIRFPADSKQALTEVRHRTEMLFEPRPEYNHATNALAIVGPRSLSENLFLDRRSFFNSYDPASDRDGKILSGILTPLVPVCGGINLEYLFSRIDNTVYGSGSKLPHNVFSLVGVGNGSEGDLRTGLPEQMIEIHDPLRLLIIVEQRREIVQKVLRANDPVREWIAKAWVNFCLYDPAVKKFFWYRDGGFHELKVPQIAPPVHPGSLGVYRNQRGNIRPCIIRLAGTHD